MKPIQHAESRPRTPRKGKPYQRDFGVPQASDQTGFTNLHSRIMKQSNGGFDHCYNAQAAMDAERQIIVAAELTECAAAVIAWLSTDPSVRVAGPLGTAFLPRKHAGPIPFIASSSGR